MSDSNDTITMPVASFVFEPSPVPSLPVTTSFSSSLSHFPIRRVYCVGKNYVDHVKEMGGNPKTSAPIFFTKPAIDGVIFAGQQQQRQQQQRYHAPPTPIVYPPSTDNLHYECELVVAIGKVQTTKTPVSVDDASLYIYGYAVGLDLTRRDLQNDAKAKRLPWDTAKYFDQSAPMGSITPSHVVNESNETIPIDLFPDGGKHYRLQLSVNDTIRQSAPLQDMIWNVPEIIFHLSALVQLKPGDLIMTGTPAGVGPVQTGDRIVGRVVTSYANEDHEEEFEDVLDPVDIVLVSS